MLFQDDTSLNFSILPENIQNVIISAVENASTANASKVRPAHFILSLLQSIDDEQKAILQDCLEEGIFIRHVMDMANRCAGSADDDESTELTGKRDDFADESQAALDLLDAMITGGDSWEYDSVPADRLSSMHLWIATLSCLDKENLAPLGRVIDLDELKDAFVDALLAEAVEIYVPSLYDEGTEDLLLEFFDQAAVEALQNSIERAGEMGYDKVMPPHLFLALISRPNGVGEWLIRRQAMPGVGPGKVAAEMENNISIGFSVKPKQLTLSQYHLSVPIQRTLESAYKLAVRHGNDIIDEPHLMFALIMEEGEGRIGDVLKIPALKIDIHKMQRHLERRIQETASGDEEADVPFVLPKSIAKSEDLTHLARLGQLPPGIGLDGPIEQIKRGLHKRENNHVLIVAQGTGIGATTLVRELARRIATGEIEFLRRKKVLWIDCGEITAEESRERLEAIIAAVKGRNDIIVCLDGFHAVIKHVGQRESDNLSIIRTALRGGEMSLIAITEARYFHELLSNDYRLLEFFTKVEIVESDKDQARSILKSLKMQLEITYGVQIQDEAIERAVLLSREFILSELMPAKAIKVLREACEDVYYEREEQSGDGVVTTKDIIVAVSRKTGIDESTLSGIGTGVDYEAELSKFVVGQEEAVKAVAQELDLIKAGFKHPEKPASIMLFAGLTGTGKTELAKAVAKLYSASRKLSTYTMGNFLESHSISGLLGSPPGYVGYESGGRIVNELNADPYSVFLLDEVEKAHPDIWKPFLNLFDEGWIVDQRNVKAYGNRAIFILTSNAGAELIPAEATESEMKEIAEKVKKELLEVEHETARQKCFSPEFLARITKIIAFKPLSDDAMRSIAELKVSILEKEWSEIRGKELDIRPDVVKYIAKISHTANVDAEGKEGGRIVAKNMADLIETPLQNMIREDPAAYQAAQKIEVVLEPPHLIKPAITEVKAASPEEVHQQVQQQIDSALELISGESDVSLMEVERAIEVWARQMKHAVTEDEIERVRDGFARIREKFRNQFGSFADSIRSDLEQLTVVSVMTEARETEWEISQETAEDDTAGVFPREDH